MVGESDVIPREQLEPFTAPDKNITDTEQRRYSALQSEIGDEPLIGDTLADIEEKLLDSRVNSRAGKLYKRLAIPGGAATGLTMNEFPQEATTQLATGMAANPGEAPEIAAIWGGVAAGLGMLSYGAWQNHLNKNQYREFARSFQDLDGYRVLDEYEVGNFDPLDEVEDILTEAEVVSYDIRMDELSEELDEEGLLTEPDSAVEAYRSVLDELENIHTEGVDQKTAEGVAMYGSEFLEPFYPEDEARERAREIQSSGAAQVVNFQETEGKSGENPILHSDQVFRFEVIYNQETVATFEGTCEGDYEELGNPLVEEMPSRSTGHNDSFKDLFKEGTDKFKQVSENVGIDREAEKYRRGILTDSGGIPLYLRDAAVSTARSVPGAVRNIGKIGKGLADKLDYRKVDQ